MAKFCILEYIGLLFVAQAFGKRVMDLFYKYSVIATGGAYTGLQHSHYGLGYLLLVVALLNIALSLTPSKNPQNFSTLMRLCHKIYLFGGRSNLLLGIGMIAVNPGWIPEQMTGLWWMVLPVLLWGGAEVVSKRLVQPQLQAILEGLPPNKHLLIGFLVELTVLALIFLCMIYR